ncbi:MAG TPA: hypothetical protein VN724_09560 [Pyrinomonadaceae bacterium]|nr:hypothetical protein [Pyrinomonadaceae bacterium]
MRYVVVLLLGILLGAGVAVFFLGAPSAKALPGQPVQAPSQGGTPPGTVVVALEQSFVDAVLATTFNGLGTPTFQLGQTQNGVERIENAALQSGCTNTITLLPEGSGAKTGVQFRNSAINAPLAFTGSYNLAGSCMQFKGWAQTSIKLSFDQEKQTVFGYVNVDGVNLEGVNPIANNFVTVFVQGAINQKVNPLVLVSEPQLSLMIPVKASNGSVKARAKDVRAEVLDGSLKLYLTYEFSGVKGQGT